MDNGLDSLWAAVTELRQLFEELLERVEKLEKPDSEADALRRHVRGY